MADVNISPGEKVLLETGLHPIMLLPVLVSTLLLYIFSIVGFYYIGRYADLIGQVIPISLASLVLVGVIVLASLIVLLSVYVYSNSHLILTNENLIQVKQVGIFHRKVSVLSLTHVEDVSGTSKGLLATLFGFGDILVETAGEQHNFKFAPVSNPYPKVELINRVHQEFERKQGGGTAA